MLDFVFSVLHISPKFISLYNLLILWYNSRRETSNCMKNSKFLFLIFAALILSLKPENSAAQANLKIDNCKSVKANCSQVNEDATYVLQKEISANIWLEVAKKNSNSTSELFKDLPDGKYKVTIIPSFSAERNVTLKGMSKVHNNKTYKEGQNEMASVFVSNIVEVKRCDANNERTISDDSIKKNKVEKFDKQIDFKLFPIPASDEIQILITNFDYSNDNSFKYAIYDLNGRLVMDSELVINAEAKINVSNLENGIYFLTVQTEDFLGTQKLIINKK